VVQENREGQINLNTSEWMILSKIDGHRSIKAIAAASGLSVFDAAKMLYGLIGNNLIRLKEPIAMAPAPAAPAHAAPAHAAPAAVAGTSSSGAGHLPAAAPAAAAHTPPGGTRAATPRPAPPGGPAPASAPAASSPAPAASARAASSAGTDLMAKLNRVREQSSALLGPGGDTVVNKHYLKAKSEIERGAGFEAVEEAANQIARAAAILKGPSAAEALLEQIRALK
jgi:hypothetical protein